MSDTINLIIDGEEVAGSPGQTILEAAQAAGKYIPRLCHHPDLPAHGSCRVCIVKVNGRAQTACTQPITEGMIIESDAPEVLEWRRQIVEMLFVEGNHFCMYCEKSGNCELQAVAYRLGITAPRHPYQHPDREVDASHPDILIDRNRCVLCGRCIRASETLDGKHVFGFVGRGAEKRVAVDAEARLADTEAAATDKAMDVCPVGAILHKRVGYKVPVGQIKFDHAPIGAEVEQRSSDNA